MKEVSHKIVENGGIVRSIQNHGIREFPHRLKDKYPDFRTGQRYYEKGRYISLYYDANPTTLQAVTTILSRSDHVLRANHLKARSKLDFITTQRLDKNPYVKRVLKEEQKLAESIKAEDLAVATALNDPNNSVETIIESMKDSDA